MTHTDEIFAVLEDVRAWAQRSRDDVVVEAIDRAVHLIEAEFNMLLCEVAAAEARP